MEFTSHVTQTEVHPLGKFTKGCGWNVTENVLQRWNKLRKNKMRKKKEATQSI